MEGYDPWQRAQCLSLRKAKSASHTAKAASTAGSGTVLMDVSGQLESLMHTSNLSIPTEKVDAGLQAVMPGPTNAD
jgi:hypothetical protein